MKSLPSLLLILSTAAISGAADPASWDLSTDDTRVSVTVSNNQPVLVVLENPKAHHNWAGANTRVPLLERLSVGGEDRALRWEFKHGQANSGQLVLTFASADPKLELRSIWRARPGRGPVEHWMELVNQSGRGITVPRQVSLALPELTVGGPAEVQWIKRGGSNASTQGGTMTRSLAPGLELTLVSDCEDPTSPVPWLAVQKGQEEGLYVGWEFSGLGALEIKTGTRPDGLSIEVGLLRDFRTDVESGETFLVPPAFVGCYAGDVDEGSHSLHRFIIEKLRPPVSAGYPDPTLAYNLYLDAGGANAKEADVLRSAQTCYEMGFETFMPDAMWFPESGDWRWDTKRFPRGVAPIEQYVHGHGMKLALWCAWSNGGVSEDPGAMSGRGSNGKPEWFSAAVGPDWKGGLICVGSPEAKQWALRKTQALVAEEHLDYLKHDYSPIVNRCVQTTHRHHYGVDAGYWAALGYYEVQEALLRAFPGLLLENCSAGGHIKDFGAMKRNHYIVTTDTLSNLPDRQSLYDSTFAFPPLMLQAYTYERIYAVPGDDPGPYLWRSAMMGAWQIDPTNTRSWTDEEFDSAKRAAEIYKAWIRPMLKDAKVHHILPRPDGIHWDGMFYWSAALHRGTLFIFRPDASEEKKTVTLKGLEAGARYWVWAEDASLMPGLRTGEELMRDGLPVSLATRYSSDLIYLQADSAGRPEGLAAPGEFGVLAPETSGDEFACSALLRWEPSAGAKSYRVRVSASADLAEPIVEKSVYRSSVRIKQLAPGKTLHWRVEAVSSGGAQTNRGAVQSFPTPPLKPLPGVVFVSDMPWVRSVAGANNTVHRDKNYGGSLISIAGKQYPKGVWTHAFNDASPAEVEVDVQGRGFALFKADVGAEDSAGAGSVQFQVVVDGELKAESPVLTHGGKRELSAGVAGARKVTLRVLNGGDGFTCDHAAWGFARFLEKDGEDPLAGR